MRYIICIFLFIFILLLTPLRLNSQVKISVEIENYDDSIFYLIKYKSDQSLEIVGKSSVSHAKKVFRNDKYYDEGIYVLTNSKQQPIFEILIGKDQTFSIHVEELMDLNSYSVKRSKETYAYFDIYTKTNYNKLYIKALENEMEYFPDNVNKIDSLKIAQNKYLESMIVKDRNYRHFINTYIAYNKEMVIPQEFKDNTKQYVIDHYFDEFKFSDVRVLNSNLLKNKLDDYFNNYMYDQKPEDICKKIFCLIEKSEERGFYLDPNNYMVRDYILWYLYSKYFYPENIENELVYIYLIDNYFSKLDIENVTENIRNEMIKRADVLRMITVGQTAPTLSYIDDDENYIDLKDVDSENIVLFFYKPECQVCVRDKRILELIRKRRDDIVVLPINISEDNYENVSQDVIKRYDIMTTPTIYLLDKNKKIIAKHIKAEEIEFYLIRR